MEVLSGTRGIKKKRGGGGGEGPAHYKATSPHPLPHSGDGPWGGVGGGSKRGSSRDVSTRYLQTAEILRNTGPPAQSPPLPAQPQTSHSSQGAQRRSPLTALAISRGPAPSWATSSQRHSSPRPSGTLSRHPAPLGCWDPHRHRTQAARMQQPRACSAWARASLPPAGAGQGWGHPSTPNKMTNKRKQTKTEDSPLPRPQEGAEGGGVEGGRREQACSLGQIFCCFIRFSVNQLEFARTGVRGVRGGVSKRARAREELERTGIASCPGLHFAVIICTNSS